MAVAVRLREVISECLNAGSFVLGLLVLGMGSGCSDDNSVSGDEGSAGAPSGHECTTACDDGFDCTVDTCTDGECHHSIGPNEGSTACPIGRYCTINKGCVAAPACATNADCADAWEDDACKANPRCDDASSVCIFEVLDKDGDGHAPQVCDGDDCDDSNDSIHPTAAETCNGADDDCDGEVDEDATASCGVLEECVGGECQCLADSLCNGECVDLQTDSENCGRCDVACMVGQSCRGGACTCPAGMICGELFRKLSTEPATVLAIHQDYVVATRSGTLVAMPIADPVQDEGLVWTGYVTEVLGDGDYLYFAGGVLCARAASGCTDTTGRLDFAYAIALSEPMTTAPILVSSAVTGLLIHGDQAYWPWGDGIFTTPKLGTSESPTTVSTLKCGALAADDDALYCATDEIGVANDGVLYRLGYDGTVLATLATGLTLPSHAQVSGGYVYWTDRGLKRVAINGTSPETVATWTTEFEVSRFIVDGDHIYYVDDTGLHVMTTTGTDVRQIGTTSSIMGYAIDSTHVYWGETTGIYRAAKP